MAADWITINLNSIKLPPQRPITGSRIQEMISSSPRRHRLAEWPDSVLKPPGSKNTDWNLVFPFIESYVPAFEAACDVDHIPFKSKLGQTFCFSFLKEADTAKVDVVRAWIKVIHDKAAIRDCLAISFALDHDKEGGDPKKQQTEIGSLRSKAKPYNRQPDSSHREAANEISVRCFEFLRTVKSYDSATCVVAVPPSDPRKKYSLPAIIAAYIAKEWGKPDHTGRATTIVKRPETKNLPVMEKLRALEGMIRVQPFEKGARVLLVDDLYQPGVTMNYIGMKLLEAGVEAVYGLACEKTCRNDDNVGQEGGVT